MPPKALTDIASGVAIKNIKNILSIGYLPYQSVRHILIKIESAPQLRQIELNCPQIQGETGELWLKLIEKDFPMEFKSKGYMPREEGKWYKVWEKYKRDHDQSLQESEEQLRSALMGLKQNKEKNTSKIVEGRFLPSDAMPRKKRNMGPKDNTTSVLSFGGGSRTKTLTGAGVMRKARREAREVRSIHGSLSRATATPIRVLEKQHNLKPPAALVQAKRIASQPAFRTPENEQREKQQKEQRERSAAVAEHAMRAAYISDSDSDDARPAAGPSTTPTRKLARPSGSMFQRKFGGKLAPKQPLRVVTTGGAAAVARPSTELSPTSKKRPHSDADLDQPLESPKRLHIEPALRSPNKALPRDVTPPDQIKESIDKLSPSPEGSPKKAVIRKKKPVNVFMRRPARR